ncbi:hypothetical protein O181_002548 [Austropuccinia psidii MF-1]|uniref:Uncharacterized protein n=1 Tax=Austropuccinia psidii MF-1 TaxID=1389203 RepID=A0A9Q3GCQ9_9BASI|nr:hypothetical protein [Austropuccinia psidii MF-1]
MKLYHVHPLGLLFLLATLFKPSTADSFKCPNSEKPNAICVQSKNMTYVTYRQANDGLYGTFFCTEKKQGGCCKFEGTNSDESILRSYFVSYCFDPK